MPKTLLPGLNEDISVATFSTLGRFRPTMQALAPKITKARIWPEQIVPDPPVQKTTLPSFRGGYKD